MSPPRTASRRKSSEVAVEARGLRKRYGDVIALDGLDLSVPAGTVLGLLGPNGAGKTTAVSILTTLLDADEGEATVAGADVRREPARVRENIGLSGQYAAVDEVLTGHENLEMVGRLYRMGKKRSKERSVELLERFDLAEAGGRPVKTYSGGMRRRLDLAAALVAEPPVLFLDEPTTGLDLPSRLELWAIIRELVGQGTTLLLTTQYLEEADQLADEIVVIDHGKAIASGTAEDLKTEVGGERLEFTVTETSQFADALAALTPLADGEIKADEATRSLLVPITGGTPVLTKAMRVLERRKIALTDAGIRRPTLDDVFLSLTGHVTEEEDPSAQTATAGPKKGRR